MSEGDRMVDLAQMILEAHTELPEAPLDERLRMLLQRVAVVVSHCEALAATCIDIEERHDGSVHVRCRNCGETKQVAASPSQLTLPTPDPPHIDNCLVGQYLARCPAPLAPTLRSAVDALGLRRGGAGAAAGAHAESLTRTWQEERADALAFAEVCADAELRDEGLAAVLDFRDRLKRGEHEGAAGGIPT